MEAFCSIMEILKGPDSDYNDEPIMIEHYSKLSLKDEALFLKAYAEKVLEDLPW